MIFFKSDILIPLLVTNQYQIYPNEFNDLELLQNRKIAIVNISYLSGIESEVKEYFLNEHIINKILSSFERGNITKYNIKKNL